MYTLRIPGHKEGLSCEPQPTGSKLEIAKQILMPVLQNDPHGARSLPKDADCILEQTTIINVGSESRKEIEQVGRFTVGQLLPQGFLMDLF